MRRKQRGLVRSCGSVANLLRQQFRFSG